MHSVGVFAAKNGLSALLDEVEGGGEVIITRRGRPVARLSSIGDGRNRARAQVAAEGLRALSKGKTLGGISLKDLISEGRR